jgi:hypothetical protein
MQKKIDLNDLEVTSFVTGSKIKGGVKCTDYCNPQTYLCNMGCDDGVPGQQGPGN